MIVFVFVKFARIVKSSSPHKIANIMIPSILLVTAISPNNGGELRLNQCGDDFSIYLKSILYKLLTIILLFICLTTKSQGTPAVTPSCPAGQTNESSLSVATYNTTGYNSFPNNHAEYDSLVTAYAIPSKKYGSGRVATINGAGNPFGIDEHYLSLFTGYIEAPSTGVYGIGIDGDDAVEVIIDGVTVTGWYGGHGRAGSAQYTVNINLDAGYHDIVFRHQEKGGGDNYYLYWKKPGDAAFTIVPANNFTSCRAPLVLQPAVTPTCVATSPQLLHSTYNTTGYNTHPVDHSQYNTLVNNYAIPSKIFGSGLASTINGSGNPFGINSYYLSIFKGYLHAPVDGTYSFGVDGDDAVEVLIDGTIATGWYGGHGRAGSAQYIIQISLQAGYHNIEFRHEEYSGGDNYYLYWKKPSDTVHTIIPSPNLYHCPYGASISLAKTSAILSDPFNGITNPKAIPGAIVEYTLTAQNSGNAPADDIIIKDMLDPLITIQQSAIWASGYLTVKTPSLYGGVKTTLTDNIDGDEGRFIDTAGNREINVDCGTLTTGQDCVVTYRIIVN